MASGRKKRRSMQDELAALSDGERLRADAMSSARRQIRTLARVVVIALVVVWLLAFGWWSGQDSAVPLYVAGGLTVVVAVAALLVRRNLGRSEELGGMVADGSELSPEERQKRFDKLKPRIEKGESAAIMTMAQLQMHDEPRAALETLERANLDKGPKLVANQIRGMRAMIHLNLGEVKAARTLADEINLEKMPDPKSRANLVAVVAEAWARSGNAIEASELLDKYDADDEKLADVRLQLVRARVFASAHRNDLPGMRRNLKQLEEMSPQLMALFVGQKRVHPLLQKEARKRLERSGLVPRQKIQAVRR